MSPLVLSIIETIPQGLLLVVGLLGLAFSIKGRARGVSGLMVGAFVVVLLTSVAGIAWRFVSLEALSWISSNQLSNDEFNLIFTVVSVAFDSAALLSWLLVAIGVVKSGRAARQPGVGPYPGPVSYPMAAQPGFVNPTPGDPQPQSQQPPN